MAIRRALQAAVRVFVQLIITTSVAVALFASHRSVQFFGPYEPVMRFDPRYAVYLQQRTTTNLGAWLTSWVPWSIIVPAALLAGIAALRARPSRDDRWDLPDVAVRRFVST
jgi:hypothetical protein